MNGKIIYEQIKQLNKSLKDYYYNHSNSKSLNMDAHYKSMGILKKALYDMLVNDGYSFTQEEKREIFPLKKK
jgi:hypothetical protein